LFAILTGNNINSDGRQNLHWYGEIHVYYFRDNSGCCNYIIGNIKGDFGVGALVVLAMFLTVGALNNKQNLDRKGGGYFRPLLSLFQLNVLILCLIN